MPVRSYKDQNNAIIISIMFLSFIFSIIFTSEYYSEDKNYDKNKIKKYYTIAWSIFAIFSFMFIISNINCKHIRNNVSSPKV